MVQRPLLLHIHARMLFKSRESSAVAPPRSPVTYTEPHLYPGRRRPHPLHLRPTQTLFVPQPHLRALPAIRRLPRRRSLFLLHVADRRLPDVVCRRHRGHDLDRVPRGTSGREAEEGVRVEDTEYAASAGGAGAVCRYGVDCESFRRLRRRGRLFLQCQGC